MSYLPEKSVLPSRLLSCLIAFSMFLLISSSLSILEFHDNYFIPISVLQLIPQLVNDTIPNANPDARESPVGSPVFANSDTQESPVRSPVFLNKTSNKQEIIIPEVTSQAPNPKLPEDEPEKHRRKQCDETQARLKVYMYDLPPKFHFGLLGWNGSSKQTWPSLNDQKNLPSYPGGLNLQHSTEYWLTLDLLASDTENVVRPCSAIRVKNSSEADVVFVPFFSSLSYNRYSKRHQSQKGGGDRVLQQELVKLLERRKEWKRFGGMDHLIVAHHPNSMLTARKRLSSSMFVLSDFGRYSTKIANLKKDVIAPYKHMVRSVAADNSSSFHQRPVLVFFQGAIYRKDVSYIYALLQICHKMHGSYS